MSSSIPFVDPQARLETISAVEADRSLAHVTFSVNSESSGGVSSYSSTGKLTQAGESDTSRVGRFSMSSDEPAGLLGSDSAVSPAETVLHGLAGCYVVTLANIAASRDITLNSIAVELEFDHDLSGFLGIDPKVRKGAQEIRANVRIDAPGRSRSELEELVAVLEKSSPIRDTLANPVPVVTSLVS